MSSVQYASSMLAAFLFLGSSALAAHEKGNGGVVQVCRNPETHEIVSVELLDLVRARNEFHLELIDENPDVDIYDPYQDKLAKRIFTELYEAGLKWDVLHGQIDSLYGNAKYGAVPAPAGERLLSTDDANPPPPSENCSYEQLAVFTDGDLIVQPELMTAIQKNSVTRTAFYLHEAIYKFARQYSGAKNSVKVQELVGYLLAKDDHPVEIQSLLRQIFKKSWRDKLPRKQEVQLPSCGALDEITNLSPVLGKLDPRSSDDVRILLRNPRSFIKKWLQDIAFGFWDSLLAVTLSIPGQRDFDLGHVWIGAGKSKVITIPLAAEALVGAKLKLGVGYFSGTSLNFEIQVLQGDRLLRSWSANGIGKNCKLPDLAQTITLE